MKLNVLQRWRSRPDDQSRDAVEQQAHDPDASCTTGVEPVVVMCATPTSGAAVPNHVPAIGLKTRLATDDRKPRRRRKHYKVSSLKGPENVSPAQKQAAALLYQIADTCPQLIGSWVKKNELRDWYFELAALEGWEAQGWIRVAKALKEWTTSQRITRNGEKLTYYKVIGISRQLKRRAAQLSRQSSPVATAGDTAPGTAI